MKRIFLFFSVCVFFAATIQFSGCAKKEDNPVDSKPSKPGIPTLSLKGPNTQSTNTYASMANMYALLMNGELGFLEAFRDLQGTQNGNVWTYTVTAGTLTETITATVSANGSTTWKVIFNGTIDNSTTVNNWVAFEGTTSADGKSGNWKVYEPGTTTLSALFEWSTDGAGIQTATLQTYNNGATNGKMTMTNNPNGSGTLKIYSLNGSNNTLYLSVDISWLANGTGSYTTYTQDGTSTTGTW